HARINRAHENALAAARPFRSRLIHPGRNTAANELVTGAVVDGNFRIEAPFLLPRARIKRDHFIEGAAENKRAFEEDGRHLESRMFHSVGTAHHVAGAIDPCLAEIRDIFRRDGRSGRMAGAARVSAIMEASLPLPRPKQPPAPCREPPPTPQPPQTASAFRPPV